MPCESGNCVDNIELRSTVLFQENDNVADRTRKALISRRDPLIVTNASQRVGMMSRQTILNRPSEKRGSQSHTRSQVGSSIAGMRNTLHMPTARVALPVVPPPCIVNSERITTPIVLSRRNATLIVNSYTVPSVPTSSTSNFPTADGSSNTVRQSSRRLIERRTPATTQISKDRNSQNVNPKLAHVAQTLDEEPTT